LAFEHLVLLGVMQQRGRWVATWQVGHAFRFEGKSKLSLTITCVEMELNKEVLCSSRTEKYSYIR